MGVWLLLATLAGAADAPARATAESPARSATAAVTRYDPSFFVDIQPNTAFDMVTRLPGFSFDGGAAVRGFADAAGNVLVDGDRPTSKQDSLQSVLQRIPASQVDHIDLIRGGAPGIDMHGQTVLANVVRKSGDSTTGVVAAANNFFADGRSAPALRLETTRKWSGHTLELSFFPSFFVDDGAGNGPRLRTDAAGDVLVRSFVDAEAGGHDLVGTGAYSTPFGGGKLRVNAQVTHHFYFDDEDDHLSTPAGTEILRDHEPRWQGELGVHFERPLGAKTTLEALGLQQLKRQSVDSSFTVSGAGGPATSLFEERDTLGETIGRAVVRYTAGPKLSLEGSAEGAYNTQDSHSHFAQSGQDVVVPAEDVTVSEKRGEAAATATWRPLRRLTLVAAMRAELSSLVASGGADLSKTLFFPKPRLLLTWTPDASDEIRFRLEREVGQLNFGDFVASSAFASGTVRAGNPDLEPSDAWVFETAYERRFHGLVLVLTGREQRIRHVVDRIPIQGQQGVFDAPGNIGSANEEDVLVDLTVPLDVLGLKHAQLKGSGTWRHSRVQDPTTGRMRPISGQHRFDYQLHFSQDLPRWKSNWGVDVFNRWTETYYRFNEVDTYRLKTWVTLFYEYKPRSDLSVRAELENVGGRGFERILQVYSGPRDTSAIQYVDDRRQDFKPYLYLRVRKTFG
jgi:hypothetical protein